MFLTYHINYFQLKSLLLIIYALFISTDLAIPSRTAKQTNSFFIDLVVMDSYLIWLPSTFFTALTTQESASINCHYGLGHHQRSTLQLIAKFNPKLCNQSPKTICIQQNLKSLSSSVTNEPLNIIYLDVWGPSPIHSIQGYHYI